MADSLFEPEIRRSLKYLVSDRPIAMECKRVRDTRLPFDQVADHQVAGLCAFEIDPFVHKLSVPAAVGTSRQRFNKQTPFDYLYTPPGKAYVLVNFRFTTKSPRKDIPKGTNRTFALPIRQFVALKGLSEAKSIPYNWFCEHAVELRRVRFDDGPGWDLVPLTVIN